MDFFDIFSGGFEGEGLFGSLFEGQWVEGLAGGIGDLFGAEGSGVFRDVLADGEIFSHARAGGSFFEFFGATTDAMFDYYIWRDVFDHKGNYQDFRRAFDKDGAEAAIGPIRDVLKGHAFLREQLQKHAPEWPPIMEIINNPNGIAAISHEYQQLGTHLPSEELRNKAYRSLVKLLHPDTNKTPEAESLIRQLNSAQEALKDPEQVAAYERALAKNPKFIEEWLSKLGSAEWKTTMEEACREGQKRIESLVEMPKEGFSKWFRELPAAGRGAVVFGVVAGVGAGTYMLAKAFEKKHPPAQPFPAEEKGNWKERASTPKHPSPVAI